MRKNCIRTMLNTRAKHGRGETKGRRPHTKRTSGSVSLRKHRKQSWKLWSNIISDGKWYSLHPSSSRRSSSSTLTQRKDYPHKQPLTHRGWPQIRRFRKALATSYLNRGAERKDHARPRLSRLERLSAKPRSGQAGRAALPVWLTGPLSRGPLIQLSLHRTIICTHLKCMQAKVVVKAHIS